MHALTVLLVAMVVFFYNVESENAFIVGFRIFECSDSPLGFDGAATGMSVFFSNGTQVQGICIISTNYRDYFAFY